MKTGEAANLFGVSIKTIVNWIEHPLLKHFFSEGATRGGGGVQRVLTDADVLVLNTIRHIRSTPGVEWEGVAAYLDSGNRFQEFPQNAANTDTRTIPLPQAEQSARTIAALAERDAALSRVRDLETELIQLRTEHKEEANQFAQRIDGLMRELMDANRQIGRLEGQLDALRSKD